MIKNLLVPLDGTDLSERAMMQSIELARQLNAAIVGFIAEPDVPMPHMGTNPQRYQQEAARHVEATDTHAHGLLSLFGQRALEAGVPFTERHLRADHVATAIARVAEELEDPLIVMVTHGRGPFAGLLFGSHTKTVMDRTKVPLLVLH